MSDAPMTAAQYREAQGAEWGTYVAVQEIEINSARAFNEGDPVPVSHVTSGLVAEHQVKNITTKAGRVAAGIEPKG